MIRYFGLRPRWRLSRERRLGGRCCYCCVISVCDEANEACPFFPGAESRLHWPLRDPSQATGTDEERLGVFRAVRDELRERIERELVRSPYKHSRKVRDA
jgi:hypothetical protein